MKKTRLLLLSLGILVTMLLGASSLCYAASIGETLNSPEAGWQRIDDTDSKLNYNPIESWNLIPNGDDSFWFGTARHGKFGTTTNFSFYGSKLRIIAQPYEQRSTNVEVKIDGETIGNYSLNGDWTKKQTLLFEVKDLEKDVHKVEITNRDKDKEVLIDAFDIDVDGYLVDYVESPTLKVNAQDKAKLSEEIYADIVIDNAVNICAEDIKINYDKDKLEFIGAENVEGMKIYKEDISTASGINRYISASLGKDNAANGEKVLFRLKFKAIATGEAKIDITNGRIADNATLEVDVEEANCGEKTILIESVKDVNRTGEFTLLDLGIDAWYYGSNADLTDLEKHDADIIENGIIDDDDLTEITLQIINNKNYLLNK